MIPKFNIKNIYKRLNEDEVKFRSFRSRSNPVPFRPKQISIDKDKVEVLTLKNEEEVVDTRYYELDYTQLERFPPVSEYELKNYGTDLMSLYFQSMKNRYKEFDNWSRYGTIKDFIRNDFQRRHDARFMPRLNGYYPFFKDADGGAISFEDALVIARDMFGLNSSEDTPWSSDITLESDSFLLDQEFLDDSDNIFIPYLVEE